MMGGGQGGLPGIMGAGQPLGQILNAVGGGGMADLVKNISSGPVGQLMNVATQGSGIVGQMMGQGGLRPENLANLAASFTGMPGPLGASAQAGMNIFQQMNGIMEQANAMTANLRQAAFSPQW